ncbi:MAG: hypothetical protein WKF43_09540 [Acidimicrobiales bacterium]
MTAPTRAGAAIRRGDHRARGMQWRLRAESVLAPITERMALTNGARALRADLLLLDQWAVDRAGECLAQVVPDEEFEESVRTARRRVGLAVLARLRMETGLDPLTAFETVMRDRSEWARGGFLDWLDGLDPGGRGALAAEACGYAIDVVSTIGPHRLGNAAVCGPSDNLDWDVPHRAVRVRGRCDLLHPRGSRPPERRLLVTTSGLLGGAEVRGAHAALVYTLNAASVPAGVTVLSAAEGSVRIQVDDDLLDGALSRLAAAAHAAVAARFGPIAAAIPGPWCRRCGRRGDCDDGDGWVAATPVRAGGLLATTD